jgi:uncharacterized membrane protein
MTGERQPSGLSEHTAEQLIGRVLQAGVALAASLVVCGAILFLRHGGAAAADFTTFHASDAWQRGWFSIVRGAIGGDALSLIEAGLLALILTPIARVALMLGIFLLQRDRLYILLTTIVLTLLLYSFLTGVG